MVQHGARPRLLYFRRIDLALWRFVVYLPVCPRRVGIRFPNVGVMIKLCPPLSPSLDLHFSGLSHTASPDWRVRRPHRSCRWVLSLIPVELMQRLSLGCLSLILIAIVPAWCRAESGPECDMPAGLTTPSASLPRVAAALTKAGGLDILALGSGSTVGDTGPGAGPALSYRVPEGSFPYRMVDALRSMRPALRFNLTVKGGRNMTADAMLPVLRREMAADHYDLVLWQTGTVEAVQGLRPDLLHGVLEVGAKAVEAAHADLVLIDLQFSRFLRANTDLNSYETVLVQMTKTQTVTLFHRFDLTRGWVNTGQVDLERVSRDQRDKTIATLNECLGQALARYVLAGAGEH